MPKNTVSFPITAGSYYDLLVATNALWTSVTVVSDISGAVLTATNDGRQNYTWRAGVRSRSGNNTVNVEMTTKDDDTPPSYTTMQKKIYNNNGDLIGSVSDLFLEDGYDRNYLDIFVSIAAFPNH